MRKSNTMKILGSALSVMMATTSFANANDWNGPHLGVSLSYHSWTNGNISPTESYGYINFGYDHNVGSVVVGAEVEYGVILYSSVDIQDIPLYYGGRIGVPAGNGLVYGSVGQFVYSEGNDVVYNSFGGGFEWAVTERMSVDVEYRHFSRNGTPWKADGIAVTSNWHF